MRKHLFCLLKCTRIRYVLASSRVRSTNSLKRRLCVIRGFNGIVVIDDDVEIGAIRG